MTWRKPIERLKHLSFRTKLFLSNLILIVLIATAIGSLVIAATSRYTEIHAKDLSLQVVHQITDSIDYRRHEFMNSTIYLLNDPLLRQMLITQEEELTPDRMPAYRQRMNTLLSQFGTNNRYIHSIQVQSRRGFVFGWAGNGSSQVMNDEQASSITHHVNSLMEASKQETIWTSSAGSKNEVTFARYFVDINQVNQQYGLLIFQVDSSFFLDLRTSDSLIQNDNMAILNEHNELLLGNPPFPSKDMSQTVLPSDPSQQAQTSVTKVNGTRYLIAQERNPSGWNVLCMIPMSRLLGQYRILEWNIILIAMGAILISAIIAFYLSNSTTRHIKLLERTMRKVEDGDFQVRVTPLGSDEIGILALRFNTMLDRLDELIHTVYSERLAKQQAEFSVLLAQINPHFLYNTLGTIRWYSRIKQVPEIERMIASLIHLLKSSVRKTSETHTLAEEIAYIQSYIDIQKVGYGDAFEVQYEIEDDLLPCKVLHMTLQPLVENSILHGLEMSKGNGLIRICAYRIGDDLEITIEDNGIGMDSDQIKRILTLSERSTSYPGLHSIGVRSVNERIQLYFGSEYGLTYEGYPGQGTKAILRLPAIQEETEAS